MPPFLPPTMSGVNPPPNLGGTPLIAAFPGQFPRQHNPVAAAATSQSKEERHEEQQVWWGGLARVGQCELGGWGGEGGTVSWEGGVEL